MQVTGGGSNLSYGIRSLYTKQFSRFDAWIANDCKPVNHVDKPAVKSEAGVENGMEVDAEAEEAAAILESLMGTTGQGPDTASAAPKKRKASSDRGDAAGKVRTIAGRLRGHPCVSPAPLTRGLIGCRKSGPKGRSPRTSLTPRAFLKILTRFCVRFARQAITKTRSSCVTDVTRVFISSASLRRWMTCPRVTGSALTALNRTTITSFFALGAR